MTLRVIKGSDKLGKQIKSRRNELGLTIGEAASRAGVGVKTWCRYEAGESIRLDKAKGVCIALNWLSIPDNDSESNDKLSISEFINHETWSAFLSDEFGELAALSFAIGSDLLEDAINDDLNELSTLPQGSHLGELGSSWLRDMLPEQFLTQYDYDFLYNMKCTLKRLRRRAKSDKQFKAHSVLEELIIFLCNEEAYTMIEICGGVNGIDSEELDYYDEWVFDLFDDMDIVTYLYSNIYLTPDNEYHFSNWTKRQFYIE